jgi:hypothetical protein
MAENVSSSALFHFTSSIKHLKGILRDGFCPRYCLEYTLDAADRKAVSQRRHPTYALPMVCFCDLPLSLIKSHLEEYGHYGIGLTREWGIRNGLAPVIYTHVRARTRQPVKRLITRAAKSTDASLAKDLNILAAYTKPYEGSAWRKRHIERRVKFYNEREWRYVPEPSLLNWEDFNNYAKKDKLHKWLQKEYALPIHPSDVQYLILPPDDTEDNVLDLYKYLMKLYRKRFGEKEAILVSTTIMTSDCIFEDV